MWDIKKVIPNSKNPNTHSEEQIERLSNLIKFYGFRHPLIVSHQSGKLVVGHGRLLAAKRLKLKKVPVVVQDFESEEIEYGFMVADNAISGWSELDLSSINAELENLGPFDLDMLAIENFELEPADRESKKRKARPCPECGYVSE